MKFDRFDFEQAIIQCWDITKDISTLFNRLCNGPDLSKDEVQNYLLGLETIYEVKFNELWDMFSLGVKDKNIS
jgi:hypothetical protein